jgi:hypothetical protein
MSQPMVSFSHRRIWVYTKPDTKKETPSNSKFEFAEKNRAPLRGRSKRVEYTGQRIAALSEFKGCGGWMVG